MSNATAIWSAVAASFAALSTFFTILPHRRNLVESMRPELVLLGWARGSGGPRNTGIRDLLEPADLLKVSRLVSVHGGSFSNPKIRHYLTSKAR